MTLNEKLQEVFTTAFKVNYLVLALDAMISDITYASTTVAVPVAAAYRTINEGHTGAGDAEVGLVAVLLAHAAVSLVGRVLHLV